VRSIFTSAALAVTIVFALAAAAPAFARHGGAGGGGSESFSSSGSYRSSSTESSRGFNSTESSRGFSNSGEREGWNNASTPARLEPWQKEGLARCQDAARLEPSLITDCVSRGTAWVGSASGAGPTTSRSDGYIRGCMN
jgi:hypothetical protein